MIQYLDLLKNVFENGTIKQDRTGVGTKSIFGWQMRFDLSKGFPLLTTKKLHIKSIVHELLWFIKGDTLNPGIYCLTKDVVSMNTGEAIAKKNSKIRVEEHTEPYSSFLGNNIYKVQHVLTKQELYISNEDIKR